MIIDTETNETKYAPKVAFIAHPTDISLFRTYVKQLRPDKNYDDKLVLKLFEWSPAYPAQHWDDILVSPDTKVEGLFIMVPFLPEMKDIKLKAVVAKIESALEIASKNKCTVAALGAFTSIVLQGREKELSEKYNILLTSGNTLTASLIIKGVLELISLFNVDYSKTTMSIVGASGDIGSGCVAFFGNKVKRMILSARSNQSVEPVVQRLKSDITCDVEITSDVQAAIKASNIVIFATSAYTQLCDIEDFKPGTIVCDASAPLNVRFSNGLRDDVFLFHGGIAKLPKSLDIKFDIGLACPDHFYGCQTEGILIAMNNELPCSWGRGNITKEIIEKYLSMIESTRTISAAFSAGSYPYTDADMERFSKKWSSYKL